MLTQALALQPMLANVLDLTAARWRGELVDAREQNSSPRCPHVQPDKTFSSIQAAGRIVGPTDTLRRRRHLSRMSVVGVPK